MPKNLEFLYESIGEKVVRLDFAMSSIKIDKNFFLDTIKSCNIVRKEDKIILLLCSKLSGSKVLGYIRSHTFFLRSLKKHIQEAISYVNYISDDNDGLQNKIINFFADRSYAPLVKAINCLFCESQKELSSVKKINKFICLNILKEAEKSLQSI